MDQIFPRRTYTIRNRKSEHHHWIQHIRISLGIKLQLQLAILTFWIKFIQKICSGWKKKMWTYYVILHIWIILRTKFQLKLTIFEFLDQIYPKRVFSVETRTSSPRTTSVCFLCSKGHFNYCFRTFRRSQKSHYFEHSEREIGYVLTSGLFYLKIV